MSRSNDAEVTDEALMIRVRNSDVGAFEELYDRHSARAFRVARSICRDQGRAEDVVQEGFYEVWRSRRTYEPHGGSFRAWAMTVVRHRAIDAIRHDASRPRVAEPNGEASDPDQRTLQDEVIARDEGAALRQAMRCLSEVQAEVIELAFFGQLSHSEIAAQLDLPPGTVKGRMRLGLEKLRRNPAITR